MATFDPDRPQEVAADASDYAMGAELSQVGRDGKTRPIAFFSKKFSDAELNYEIHDKELLAIVRAMDEWRHYLEGAKYQVTVYSDHHNLTYFTTTKELTRRQARWYEALSKYDFVIKHRKGSLNGKADALSRKAEYRKGLPNNEATILTKGKDGLIRLHGKTLALAMTASLDNATKEIKEAQEKDSLAQRVFKNRKDHPSWTEEEGVLLFKGLIYLPETLRREYVSRIHGLPMHGHQGISKTLERVSRNYYFPGMRPLIELVISQCHTCNTSKSARHKPYGKLQPNEAPQRNWQIVTMDFITKLPKSKDPLTGVVYDSILNIIDRLSKYGIFVPYLESSNAEQLADTVIRVLVSHFGMPEQWITDRDKLFTSTFWKSLMGKLGVHHKMSTSFHPQTDGQTERVNQIVEQYIRCFTDYGQTNWVKLLPMAQFAYNKLITSQYSDKRMLTMHKLTPSLSSTLCDKCHLTFNSLQKETHIITTPTGSRDLALRRETKFTFQDATSRQHDLRTNSTTRKSDRSRSKRRLEKSIIDSNYHNTCASTQYST
jgi:hypothetical protein